MKYIKVNYIKEIEYSELDIENLDEILGASDDYQPHLDIVDGSKGKSWAGDAEAINMDTLINALNELKQLGCNYVEVMHHCDHHGYCINGLNMRVATPEEIDNYLAEKENKNLFNTEHRIAMLEKELENELQKLKNLNS